MQQNSTSIESLTHICKACGLSPSYVVQSFADVVSVYGFLDENSDIKTKLAAEIFSGFHEPQPVITEENEERRQRAITNIKAIMKVLLSSKTHEAKQRECSYITAKWYHDNRLKGAGSQLKIGHHLAVSLPANFILHCHFFSYRPDDFLKYFIKEVSTEAFLIYEKKSAAFRFLLQCIGSVCEVKNI